VIQCLFTILQPANVVNNNRSRDPEQPVEHVVTSRLPA